MSSLILTQRSQRREVLKASGNLCAFAALRETLFPLVTVLAMASQPLPRHLPIRQRLLKRFSGHRRLGGPFPMTFPVTAVLAVASQGFPRSPPKWQCLSKRFPVHRRFGGGSRTISPPGVSLSADLCVSAVALGFTAEGAEVRRGEKRPSRGPDERSPGRRRFGGCFRDISPTTHGT
jgi:hypothetical protein